MGFSRQEYWSRLPFPSPGDLPDPGIKPRSPALQPDSLPSEPPGKAQMRWKLASIMCLLWSFPSGAVIKNPPTNAGRRKRCRFNPWVGNIPCRRTWQPTPVFLPRKSHGQRSLVGYSPLGCKESDTTEWLSAHMHLLCAGCLLKTALCAKYNSHCIDAVCT